MSSLDCGGGSSFELSFAYLCEPLCRLFPISNIAGEVISMSKMLLESSYLLIVSMTARAIKAGT